MSRNPPDQDLDSKDQALDLKHSNDLEKIIIKKVSAKYNAATINAITVHSELPRSSIFDRFYQETKLERTL